MAAVLFVSRAQTMLPSILRYLLLAMLEPARRSIAGHPHHFTIALLISFSIQHVTFTEHRSILLVLSAYLLIRTHTHLLIAPRMMLKTARFGCLCECVSCCRIKISSLWASSPAHSFIYRFTRVDKSFA